MRRLSSLSLLALCGALGACAPAFHQGARPDDPAALARLERATQSATPSAGALRALGIAYYERGRDAEARGALARARTLSPEDGTTALYLGLAAERQGDLAAARDAYTSYMRVGRTAAVRRQLEQRLAALTRRELAAAAKAAVAHEAELGAVAGPPNTVAVLPFSYHGADSTLRPLARGLTELLAVDLGRVAALTVVERMQVSALLDEMALAERGVVDTTTAARAGHLLQAGRVVQGALTELPNDALRADAAVVSVASTQPIGTVRQDDKLDAVFALEKRLAINVIATLGVPLSASDRAALERRPTRRLAAFLAFGHGLLAEDAGRLDDAQRYYDDAARLDPNFDLARQHGMDAMNARQGAAISTTAVRAALRGSAEGRVVAAAGRGQTSDGTSSALAQGVNAVNPSPAAAVSGGVAAAAPAQRDPVSSTAGLDAIGAGTGHIHIIIHPPER